MTASPHRTVPPTTEPVPLPAAARWRAWERHFLDNHEEQRRRDAALDHDAPVTLTDVERVTWVRSLQKFQVGESGDGAHLLAAAGRADDELYVTCARHFVAEEQSHARLLAMLLERLHAEPVEGDWTDAAFVHVRRLMGVATELAVIQVAEGVALVYYGALADGAPDPLVRDVAARILVDEEAHVRFHADRVADDLARWSRPRREALRGLWVGAQLGATLVVAVDHRRALRDCGVPLRQAVREVTSTVAAVRRRTYALGARRAVSPG